MTTAKAQSPRWVSRVQALPVSGRVLRVSRAATRLMQGAVPALLSVTLWASPVVAAPFPIDDERPAASVPSEEARRGAALEFGYWLMEVADRGDRALGQGDFTKARAYFEALALAVPERAISYGRLCTAFLGEGNRPSALASCRAALGKEGATAADATRLIALLLSQGQVVSSETRAEVEEIIAHLEGQQVHRGLVAEQRCELAEKLADAALLRQCIPELAAAVGEQGRVTAYRWRLAILENDTDEAEALLNLAQNDPAFSEEARARLARETETLRSAWASKLPAWPVWVAALGAALVAAGAWRWMRSHGTMLRLSSPSRT